MRKPLVANKLVGEEMPQRPIVGYDPQDEAALRRIKYFTGKWDRLNWYVQLMGENLDILSEGELLTLQEEFVALQRTLCHYYYTLPKPTLDAIKAFQVLTKQHLECLVNNDETFLGPFPVEVEIRLPKAARERGEKNDDWISKEFGLTASKASGLTQISSCEIVKGMQPCLLYHLAKLLQQFGASIKRCKHCSEIFLQPRSNANYCGRKCQSRAAMREIRKKQKEQKEWRSKRRKPSKKGV
jgi:hypothetical protein